MMQLFDITVPANKPQRVSAAGRYIKYVAGNNGGGDVTLIVTPGGHGSSKITLVPGQAYRVSHNAVTPDSWTLANSAGGATIAGQVVIGDGQIDDPTINGTVQIVDGSKARTLGNAAFAVGNGIGAGAGVYGRVQLWNPANSGVRAVINSIAMRANGTAQQYSLAFNQALLASSNYNGLSKLAGGAVAKCIAAADTTAVANTPPNIMGGSVQANSLQQIGITEPIILPPGYGVMLYSNVLNADAVGFFEWYEEPNV